VFRKVEVMQDEAIDSTFSTQGKDLEVKEELGE
jgi:hypothetical protein